MYQPVATRAISENMPLPSHFPRRFSAIFSLFLSCPLNLLCVLAGQMHSLSEKTTPVKKVSILRTSRGSSFIFPRSNQDLVQVGPDLPSLW